MTFMDRVTRLVVGLSDKERVATLLGGVYSSCTERARLLGRHAMEAPNGASVSLLRELQSSEVELSKHIATALIAAGGRPSQTHSVLPPPASPNHWGRLVQDLELHRHATRELQEASFRVVEDLPELANLLLEASEETRRQCEHLRTLIARADPQALD